MRETSAEALREARGEVERLAKREFRSPDEALASLVEVQSLLNAALAQMATDPRPMHAKAFDIRETLEDAIRRFIEVARKIAKDWGAVSLSIQVGGFPPSISVSLTWTLGG